MAKHITLGQKRAIKRILKKTGMHDIWLKEALVLKELSHPAIPIIYDVEEDEQYSYIVMEYLEGIPLSKWKETCGGSGQGASKISAGEIALQVCRLLKYLHNCPQPFLYLDLKPDNLLLCNGTVKMIDFGAVLPKREWEGRGIFMGTRGYAAPELMQGRSLDERCDIYSFGMLLFFLFTGEEPKREHIRIKNIDSLSRVDPAWKEVINRCLKYLPGMRFSTMEIIEDRICNMIQHTFEDRNRDMSGNGRKILRIAGAFPHSGVTHISLSMAIYFATCGKNTAYREMEEKGVVESLYLQKKKQNKKTEMFFHGVTLLRGDEQKETMQKTEIEIQDFGYAAKSGHLYKEKQVALVCSGASWERAALLHELACFTYPPVLCVNFTQGAAFSQMAGALKKYKCIRVPYMPDAVMAGKQTEKSLKEFCLQLLEEGALCLGMAEGE